MLYVSKDKYALLNYVISHPDLHIHKIPNELHFSEMPEFAESTNWNEDNYYTYETLLMEYIDPHLIRYVVNKDEAVDFAELFKEQLVYAYPGEILINVDG